MGVEIAQYNSAGTTVQLGAFKVVAAGDFTTAGGDANETITSAEVQETDLAIVVVKSVGGTPRTIVSYDTDAGSIGVVMSGNPGTDHVLSYVVLRTA